MNDSVHTYSDEVDDELAQPSRPPTTREKASVVLPAVVAILGIVLMLAIVFTVAAIR